MTRRAVDGPPVRDGKPYSQIAHLAEDVVPFVAIANRAPPAWTSAPQIYEARSPTTAADRGPSRRSVVFRRSARADPERYAACVEMLVTCTTRRSRRRCGRAQCRDRLPIYDRDAMLIEAELLLDCICRTIACPWPTNAGGLCRALACRAAGRARFPADWVLPHFHSPNLDLAAGAQGHRPALGLLIFQDAMMGPAAYDLASLLQDARVDVPNCWRVELLGSYVKQRAVAIRIRAGKLHPDLCDVAAQRARKILGDLARLNKRDGKRISATLPRVWAYLQRSLAHSFAGALKDWYTEHVPVPEAPPQPQEFAIARRPTTAHRCRITSRLAPKQESLN